MAAAMDPDADGQPANNIPEFSVSEISQAVKRTIEGAFDRVRVRGEISRVTTAASGHMYLSLKDDKAVLDSVCWRNTANQLRHRPEQGLEMVATGRLTTYAGRSSYQLIIESIEPAGVGALMALLEERRKKLGAEGLFDDARKQPIPWLPDVIGVVTSPTGAVIRDIMHRLRDRFPRHVLLWPVMVQGDGAAEQVAAAIEGFNRLAEAGPVPRPDVLIVARGGGSVEDLWAFNEEIVVRAAAGSTIPLISAIGHETDTTLIDFAADRRAPTPTAAAEMAVPVRAELEVQVLDAEQRMVGAAQRQLDRGRGDLRGLARGLPDPVRLVETAAQDLDNATESLRRVATVFLGERRHGLRDLAERLRHPRELLADKRGALAKASAGLRLKGLTDRLDQQREQVIRRTRDLDQTVSRQLEDRGRHVANLGKLLESYSYEQTLSRGFAVVLDERGEVLSRAAAIKPGMALTLKLQDGERQAVADGDPPPAKPRTKSKKKSSDDQGALF
ncbi:MAG: exodeoxyribonuclease VII large subunit [Pseudomonadota bacterium]